MKVIVLIGDEGVGKTTLLNQLYERLISNGAKLIKERKQVLNDPRDFECVLSFKNWQVAIYSMGDIVKYINQAIKSYNDYDFLVCACRSDKLTCKTLRLPNNRIEISCDKNSINDGGVLQGIMDGFSDN